MGDRLIGAGVSASARRNAPTCTRLAAGVATPPGGEPFGNPQAGRNPCHRRNALDRWSPWERTGPWHRRSPWVRHIPWHRRNAWRRHNPCVLAAIHGIVAAHSWPRHNLRRRCVIVKASCCERQEGDPVGTSLCVCMSERGGSAPEAPLLQVSLPHLGGTCGDGGSTDTPRFNLIQAAGCRTTSASTPNFLPN